MNSAPAPFQLFSVSLHPRCSQPSATTYEINAQLSMSMVAINGFQLLTLTRKAKIFQRGFVFKLNQNAVQACESGESPLTSPWASETWFKRSFSTQHSLVFAFTQCVQLSRHSICWFSLLNVIQLLLQIQVSFAAQSKFHSVETLAVHLSSRCSNQHGSCPQFPLTFRVLGHLVEAERATLSRLEGEHYPTPGSAQHIPLGTAPDSKGSNP